jgi:hypothetical protein
MVGHIYGREDLLEEVPRPNVLIKELELYVNYLNAEIKNMMEAFTEKKHAQLYKFKAQLLEGIDYYKSLFTQFPEEIKFFKDKFYSPLLSAESTLTELFI